MATQRSVETHSRTGVEPNLEEIGVDRLEISREWPMWLSGALVRVTPSLTGAGERALVRRWFDGLAMLHSVLIDGDCISSASRFVDSKRRLPLVR